MSFRPPACMSACTSFAGNSSPAVADSAAAHRPLRPQARPAATTSPDASQDLAMIEEKNRVTGLATPSRCGSPVIAAGARGEKSPPGDRRLTASVHSPGPGAVARPESRILGG